MNAASKPKIYCFSNVTNGGEGFAIAMAEDGTVLATHLCSSELYVPVDLGVTEGCRPGLHGLYKQHYPNGYDMEFVPAKDVLSHPGLSLAFERNRKLGENNATNKNKS